MEEWLEPLPEKLLADSIRAAYRAPRAMHGYFEKVILLLQEGPMEDALSDPEVAGLVKAFSDMERRSLDLVDQDASFYPDDADHEVVIVDLTRHNRKPDFIRNTAFIRYPEALATGTQDHRPDLFHVPVLPHERQGAPQGHRGDHEVAEHG